MTNTVWFHLHVESKKLNKRTNKTKTNSDTENRLVVTREEGGWEWAKLDEEVNCMVTGGN